MTSALVFFGDFSKAVSEKSSGILWGVSGDGSVWELSGIYAYFAYSLSYITNFFFFRFGFSRKMQFSPCK
jgi:hypothetical protein